VSSVFKAEEQLRRGTQIGNGEEEE